MRHDIHPCFIEFNLALSMKYELNEESEMWGRQTRRYFYPESWKRMKAEERVEKKQERGDIYTTKKGKGVPKWKTTEMRGEELKRKHLITWLLVEEMANKHFHERLLGFDVAGVKALLAPVVSFLMCVCFIPGT